MNWESPCVRNPDNLKKVRRDFAARTELAEGLPILLHVEPSGHCNLRCPTCPRGTDRIARSGVLNHDDFHRLFALLSSSLCHVVFSGWGEPLLNAGTIGMIAEAIEEGIPATMNTNGLLVGDFAAELVGAGLTTINISLDGAVSKKTHFYIEDNPFDRVVNSVAKLRHAKSRQGSRFPVIHGQFLLDDDTVGEIAKLREWAFSLGIDHVKFKRRHEIMPGQVVRSRQRAAHELRQLNAYDLVQSTEELDFSARTCAHPWESIFLACNGTLSVCSWDPFQRIRLGSIPRRFDEVWNGDRVRTLRKWHSGRTRSIGEPCRSCNRLPGYLRFEDAVEPPAQPG